MTNLNTITMNIDGEAKTFTSLQKTEYNTVSLKSIYDRIMDAALPKILDNFNNLDEILTSDCGRFTFESCVYDLRNNNANSNYGDNPYMRRAEISYKSKFVETGKEEDARWEWKTLSCSRVEVEIAKVATCDSYRSRTVFVVPQYCRWDNSATSGWIGLDVADNESTRDMDCTISYGTKVDVYADGDDSSKVEVDGTTYWAGVSTHNQTRKARIRYGGKSYNFSTPAELDAAIEAITTKMIESELLHDSIIRNLNDEQQKFDDRVTHLNDCDARRIVTNDLNKSVMGGALSLLEAAGFEKNERWHREPAENGPHYYEIQMQKDTELGVCTITANNFSPEWDRETSSHTHTARYGLTFGNGGGSADTKVDAHELLAKIEKAIALADLAC
jgi:hypothetical protein